MKGIRRTAQGFRAYVRVGPASASVLREKRFPPETSLRTMQAWRDEVRVSLRSTIAQPLPTGSLASDIARYLQLVSAMPTREERERHLQLWATALGAQTPRAHITVEDIRRVLHQWRSTHAAATCNKRRTALMHLYTVLDGKDARNPVRAVPKFRTDDPLPRGRNFAEIRQRLDAMPDSKTKARLLVMLWTGMRPVELRRAKPEDVDWKHRFVIVRTAKGGRTRTVGLTAKAITAWKLFDDLDAWGAFTMAPMNRILKRACAMADVTVYDLRHSYGTALARQRVRLDVIAALMGHSSLELTKRYTLAAVSPEAAEATRRLARSAR